MLGTFTSGGRSMMLSWCSRSLLSSLALVFWLLPVRVYCSYALRNIGRSFQAKSSTTLNLALDTLRFLLGDSIPGCLP